MSGIKAAPGAPSKRNSSVSISGTDERINSIPIKLHRLSLPNFASITLNPLTSAESIDSPTSPQEEEEKITLNAAFVCTFDPSKGNTISWIEGLDEADVEGLEYKAIASGLHKLYSDYIYFKVGDFFGLAVYHRIDADASERGARMGSTGFLSTSINSLHAQFGFLMDQAKVIIEHPGAYVELATRFNLYKATVNPRRSNNGNQSNLASISKHIMAEAGKPHERAAINGIGIWKALLLHKRVLFYTPVPVGEVCDRIASACMLLYLTSRHFSSLSDPNVLFYVNVFDVDKLKKMTNFIACTTEKIFVEKRDLYDVFVDNQDIYLSPDYQTSLCLTRGDESRYEASLDALRSASTKVAFDEIGSTPIVTPDDSHPGESSRRMSAHEDSKHVSVILSQEEMDQVMIAFMDRVNKKLFEELRLASQENRTIHSKDLALFGLHYSDKDFFRALVESYEMRVKTKFRFLNCLSCCL